MMDENPFKKVQIAVAINKESLLFDNINVLSLEVGYPNSMGEYIWKSSGRIFDKTSHSFLKTKARSGNIIDVIMPCIWNDFNDNTKEYVFDFVKNDATSTIKMKLQILFESKYIPDEKEFEFLESDTKVVVPYLEIKICEKFIGTD
jgi:hypothetical protein